MCRSYIPYKGLYRGVCRYKGRGYDGGQEAEQKQVEIMEDMRERVRRLTWELETLVTHWLRCIENTVEGRIMDSGALFHATYCKEELERFKLRSGKTLKDVRIGMSMLASKDNVLDVRKVDIYFCKTCGLGKQKNLSFIMSEKIRKLQSRSCGRAESTGIRVEAPKMLWADSVSTTYLIYRIPYVQIGLRIPVEEWRGKDTSLTHLKVFGCDSFVKIHQVIQSRYIAFVDSIYGARSGPNSTSLMKPIQNSQVVLVDIPKNLAENDSIVAEHGLSSKITQSLDVSSDTSERSENSRSFKDSGRSDEEYSEDGASSKEEGSESPQVRRSTRESMAPVRYSPSANYLLLTENGKPESYSEALSSKESV
ncbi:hypothetical protein Tco_0456737 [Tanacetum coccineum]